jgi:hypothetical protein
VDCVVWPPLQLINFTFIPLRLQVRPSCLTPHSNACPRCHCGPLKADTSPAGTAAGLSCLSVRYAAPLNELADTVCQCRHRCRLLPLPRLAVQVLYVNVANLFWNTFLSLMANKSH